ncbi:YdgA family protein [Ignatzschineria sp. LJL83]
MKKRILACALPLLLLGNSSYASSSLELFEQDYKTITETSLKSMGIGALNNADIQIKGAMRTDKVADFEVKSSIIFNDKENLQWTDTGEVVFTNYAENKGVATIILNSQYDLYSNIDGQDTILMSGREIKTQSQFDRENLQVKFSSQYPRLEMSNPNADKKGLIVAEGLVADGIYGFKDDFKEIERFKVIYKSDKVSIEVEDDTTNAIVNIGSTFADMEQNNAEKIQKTIFELKDIQVLSTNYQMANAEFLLDKIAYQAAVEVRNDQVITYGNFDVNNIKIKPANNDVTAKFGDVSINVELAPLADDLFENLVVLQQLDLNSLGENYSTEIWKILKGYFTDESSLTFDIDGKLDGHTAKKTLMITPKPALIEKLSEIDFSDTADMDAAFAGLSFFQFVEQYIEAIDLKVNISKPYFIELGSNVLLAGGEEASIESARKTMNDNYMQFQLMAVMLTAGAPLIEFVDDSIKVNVQYNDNAWMVNGQPFDLEAIANLF